MNIRLYCCPLDELMNKMQVEETHSAYDNGIVHCQLYFVDAQLLHQVQMVFLQLKFSGYIIIQKRPLPNDQLQELLLKYLLWRYEK